MFGRFLLLGWTVLVHEYCSPFRGTPLGCGFITLFCFVSDSLFDLSSFIAEIISLVYFFIFFSFCKALLWNRADMSNNIRFVRIDFEMKTLREKRTCIST